MPLTTACDELTTASIAAWHDRWVVTLGPAEESVGAPRWLDHRGATALTVTAIEGSDLDITADESHVVLVAGVLTNARELAPHEPDTSRAVIAAREIAARGADGIARLRGPFAVIAWDRTTGILTAARDHIGIAPLFHTRAGRRWIFGTSPDVLVREPGVSREIDAVALSEWLCGWYPVPEDTAYQAVKRVPAATALTVRADGSISSARYWDPSPEGQPIDWLRDDEIARFDERLSTAVSRAIGCVARPSAVFLSGGLDSIAVALTATDVAKAEGRGGPIALSLAFSEGESNEKTIQAGVARQLGITQRLVPFDRAIGPDGLIHDALALNATWPQPMLNAWAPAYMHLASLGAADGVGVVLTGRGGDEWLTVTPYLLADLFGRGDLAGAWRLIQTRRRSNNLRGTRAVAQLVWLTAGRPLLSAALDAVAPKPWHRRRRARLLAERPSWVGVDPAVRALMDERAELSIAPARPGHGFYMREARLALTHAAVMHDMEETQELGRRNGLRMVHPFWDVDLISMLYRTRPETLAADGQFKWLLRRLVAPRLPNLGLDRRGKMSAGHVFAGIMRREAAAAYLRLGGVTALAGLGVVDPDSVKSQSGLLSSGGAAGGASRFWNVLNLESWVRPRV